MKKFLLCLLAIGMTAFASASNVNIEPVKPAPIKKEVTVKVKKNVITKNSVISITKNVVANNVVVNSDEVTTCTCYAIIGGIRGSHSYSCFFCWGGCMTHCNSELLQTM